jgi:hypothetical protein
MLVGHANLLDSVMSSLAQSDNEQEARFNQQLRTRKPAADRHISPLAQTTAETEPASHSEDSVRKANAGSAAATEQAQSNVIDNECGMDDEVEEDYASLQLCRTRSHRDSPMNLPSDGDCEKSSEIEVSIVPSPAEDSVSDDDKADKALAETSLPAWTSIIIHNLRAWSQHCHDASTCKGPVCYFFNNQEPSYWPSKAKRKQRRKVLALVSLLRSHIERLGMPIHASRSSL